MRNTFGEQFIIPSLQGYNRKYRQLTASNCTAQNGSGEQFVVAAAPSVCEL